MLITFEGIDGSGKTTISRIVATALANRLGRQRVLWTNEPNSIAIRDLIRHARSEEERLFLYLTDRARHMTTILPVLNQSVVIIDRYIDSSYAYVSDDLERFVQEHGLDLFSVILMSCSWCLPDRTYLLDVPPEVAVSRQLERDGYVDMNLELLRSARARYLLLANRFPDRITVVDATTAPDILGYQIAEQILTILPPALRQGEG